MAARLQQAVNVQTGMAAVRHVSAAGVDRAVVRACVHTAAVAPLVAAHHAHNRWTRSGLPPLVLPAEPDCTLAGTVFPYGENSVSAGSKYGEPFYGSRRCPACEGPEKSF